MMAIYGALYWKVDMSRGQGSISAKWMMVGRNLAKKQDAGSI